MNLRMTLHTFVQSSMATDISSGLFWLGVIFEVLAAILQNVGLNLQKLAHHLQGMEIDRKANGYKNNVGTPNYCGNKYWWGSLIVYLAGVLLDFVALAFIPNTVSLPIGSLGLVVSAICAKLFLHEKYGIFDLFGTILIIIGAWCIVGFSNKELDLLTIKKIDEMFTNTKQTPMWFFIGATLALIATICLSYLWKNAITFSLIPGICGAFTVIFGSCISQLTLNTLQGNNQMNAYQYYLIFFGLVAMLLILNNYLQRALNSYDNMIVTPIYFTMTLLVSVLSGILFFKYLTDISVAQGIIFGVCIALIVIGCIFLSITHVKTNKINLTTYLKPQEQFNIIPSSEFDNYSIDDNVINEFLVQKQSKKNSKVVKQRKQINENMLQNESICISYNNTKCDKYSRRRGNEILEAVTMHQ